MVEWRGLTSKIESFCREASCGYFAWLHEWCGLCMGCLV